MPSCHNAGIDPQRVSRDDSSEKRTSDPTTPRAGVYLDTLAYRCTPRPSRRRRRVPAAPDAETRPCGRTSNAPCQPGTATNRRSTVLERHYRAQHSHWRYVYFEPRGPQPFLASREPINDKLLCRVFTLTYGLAQGVANHDDRPATTTTGGAEHRRNAGDPGSPRRPPSATGRHSADRPELGIPHHRLGTWRKAGRSVDSS